MLLGSTITGSASDPHTRGVPRNIPNPNEPSRALIGDPRNDENVIVSNLQATILRFHNWMANRLAAKKPYHKVTFEEVQKQVRFHYQWAVLHDFLPTIVGVKTLLDILPQLEGDGLRQGPTNIPQDAHRDPIRRFTSALHFFKWKQNPFLPVEFTVAAYRFGHSMVRLIYRLNTNLTRKDIPLPDPKEDGRQMIFATADPEQEALSLVGFRTFPSTWAVDWNLFFPLDPATPDFGSLRASAGIQDRYIAG